MLLILAQYDKKGYLISNTHPKYPELVIYNYTKDTTFKKKWNIITLNCRGLVVNTKTKTIQAIPFSKFFNINELENTKIHKLSEPLNQPFRVQEKMDGSLGIGFFYKGEFIIATRGSFESEQAKKAQEIIHKKGLITFSDQIFTLDDIKAYKDLSDFNLTICFEIIYPENRIVVNYGDDQELKIITVFNNDTGKDIFIYSCDAFNQTTLYEVQELLKSEWAKNKEGLVLIYPTGHRLKLKTEEYIKAHRIIYNMSQKQTIAVWTENGIKQLIKSIPDTYKPLISNNIKNLILQWNGDVVQTKPEVVLGESIEYCEDEEENVCPDPISITKVLGLALADSVNPCAMSVLLLMLVAITTYNPKDRKQILFSAGAFILAVIVMYMIYGFLIIKAFQFLQSISFVKNYLYKGLGVIALILGILEIKDFFKYKPGTVGTEMPMFLRPKVQKVISKITSPLGAFTLGLFVTLFLLPCTIGPYVILGGMLSTMDYLKASPYLLAYNFIFILPMIVIAFIVFFGTKNIDDISNWKDKNVRKLHLVAGVLISLLGIVMILGLF